MNNFDYTSDPLIITSATSSLTVKIFNKQGILQATLMADGYNGVSSIDIRGVVQGMFKNEQTEMSGDTTLMKIEQDKLLQAECIININGGLAYDYYVFLRGIHQLGESGRPYMATRVGVTETHTAGIDLSFKARYYKDYPLCLTLTHDSGVDIFNGQDSIYYSEDARHICLSPKKDVTIDIITQGKWVTVQFNKEPTPAHPFYIRWINDRAGWDTWMFACNQKRSRKLSANDYFERYESKGEQHTYNKAGAELVEVSTGIVSADEREAISRLIYSPLVQWYKEGYGWVNIQVDNGNTEWMTANPTDELVMSFVLPNPQINK